MFKSQQYRAGATECGELVKGSIRAEEGRKFKTWRDRFLLQPVDMQGGAVESDALVAIAEQGRRGAAVAAEEEHVLRCLGAALIMQWSALPTMLQRQIFDTAGSVGRRAETAAFRGQIARVLHKHNTHASGKPSTELIYSEARWCAAALSRWDNEGGAVRDELPM
jgi:hypothetical protein